MSIVAILILVIVVAVGGVLVYRNNKAKADKAIDAAKTAAEKAADKVKNLK